jgi:MFS family permease
MGGTVGGIGGPLFVAPASHFAEGLGLEPLAGPFIASAFLFAIGVLLMYAFLRPDPRDIGRQLAERTASAVETLRPRTFLEVLRTRPVQMAFVAMILGQVVMTTVMVMTPIQMTEHLHHTLDDVAIVIAAHVTGMYLTSPITGRVADRVGHAPTILIGAFILIIACVLAPFATDTLRLAATMFILGTGWNFCFVAGSSLLTDSLRANERARIQGTNDLVVGLVAATASLSSGFAFQSIGYVGIALAGITLSLLLFLVTMIRVQTRAAQT